MLPNHLYCSGSNFNFNNENYITFNIIENKDTLRAQRYNKIYVPFMCSINKYFMNLKINKVSLVYSKYRLIPLRAYTKQVSILFPVQIQVYKIPKL